MTVYEATSQVIPVLFIAFALEIGLASIGRGQPARTALVVVAVAGFATTGELIALNHLDGASISTVARGIHHFSVAVLVITLVAATAALPLEAVRSDASTQEDERKRVERLMGMIPWAAGLAILVSLAVIARTS